MSNKKNNRADKITFNLRVRTVMDWILQGHITKDIIAQCLAKYNVDERQAYKYIKAGWNEFLKHSDVDIENKKAMHIAVRWKLYTELIEKTTPAGARTGRAILDSIAKIDGSLVEKVDITSKGEKLKQTIIKTSDGTIVTL